MFESDPARPALSAAEGRPEGATVPAAAKTVEELDLRVLAAKFAAHSGGRVSLELSADLALEVVLNEIVEQACLATGASGAAIVLERGGEWVCRATSGTTAPDLGARLDTEAGLSGACVKTRTVQRCDDAQADPRADIEACRNLGVRSVIILPLLQNERLAGVFELFSSSASAFAERDERTLEALSQRVLKNLVRASEPLASAVKPAELPRAGTFVADYILAESTDETSEVSHSPLDQSLPEPAREAASGRGLNVITWVLGAAVLIIALLQVVRVGQRLVGGTAKAHAHAPSAVALPVVDAQNQSVSRGATGTVASVNSGDQSAERKSSSPASPRPTNATPAGAVGASDAAPPAGSLLVYENGKEVFRMPSSGADASAEDGILHRVEPEYPQEARQQGIEGPVVVDLDIGVDGKVREANVVSGPPVLAQSVTHAVSQWVFKPHRVNGQLVPMQRRITLNFKLPH
jgi:TonB family protein